LIAVIVGWIALPVSILRYQASTPKGILWMSALASFLFSIHYFLIGALAGASLTAAGGLTSLAQIFAREALTWKARFYIATPSVLLALYSSSSDLIGILAISAFAASRIAETWSREHNMRLTMVVAAFLWVAYAAATGTVPVFVAESVGLISACVALWRFKKPAGTSAHCA
jgi:hypothetical protein